MHANLENTHIIQDLETLKVIADPLRAQILELLIQDQYTVKQVAEKLGASPNKLYYHFNLLEQRGLIKVVETHLVANMIEKAYRAAAHHINVDPSLLSFTTDEGKENMLSLLTPVIDTTREDLLRSIQARLFQLERGAEKRPRQIMVSREISRISEEQIAEFSERLTALLEDFSAANDASLPGDSPGYALTIAFYPSFYYEKPDAASQ